MSRLTRFEIQLFVIACAIAIPQAALHAQNGSAPVIGMQKVVPLQFDGDVRQLPQVAALPVSGAAGSARQLKEGHGAKQDVSAFTGLSSPLASMPGPVQNFAGLSFTDVVTGGQAGAGWPANANGEAGRNHYVQAVNNAFAIYSKTGTQLAAFTENSLWSSGGVTPCNGNSFGDAVVVYDQRADRFILANFAFARDGSGNYLAPFYECIAVAKTSDPVAGGWWLYPLQMDPGGPNLPPPSTLNDYAKFGIWTDCLYMSANGFSFPSTDYVGAEFASLSISDMESGAPLTWALGIINNTTDPFTMIPSNLLGVTSSSLPPPGTPNYFVSQSKTGFAFEVRKYTAGPNCGAGGTFSGPVNVSQTAYTAPSGALVSQPNTTTLLDTLEDRLMQKVQFRKVGTAESLWVVHNVQTSPSSVLTEQWAQLDVTGTTISTVPVQQQIYTPDTTLNRWMGSIAADNAGNVALGYSTSNGVVPNFPSIAYSGRLAGDPLNTLAQGETQLVAGLGSQNFSCGGSPCVRWGDISSMSVDPADDCTFWYTNQYYSSQTNGNSGNWQTRIGSFKFPSCTPVVSALTIAKSHAGNFAQGQVGQIYTLLVGNAGGGAPTAGLITVTDTLPSGLSATAISGTGWACTLGTLTCTRSDALSPGAFYSPITVTVNVGASASSPQTNSASVSGSGSTTANAIDATTILPPSASTTTTVGAISHEPSAVGQPYSIAYTVSGTGGTPVGNVNVSDGSVSNTCTVAAGTCTLTSTTAGSKTITATYLGNGTVSASSVGTKAHVVTGALPLAISTSPAAGSGFSQSFTYTFSDAAGWQTLGIVNVLVDNFLDGRHSCYLAYAVQTNTIYLVDDGGDAGGPFAGSMLLSGSGSVSNSQCTINATGSSAVGSGNTLTLTLSLTFSSTFAGNKVQYLAARDVGTGNSDWQALGTWNVPGPAPVGPAVLGMSPARSATAAQTYTFNFTDTNGFADLAVTNVLVNNFLDGIGACYLAFAPASATSGYLYLVDDAGDGKYAAGSPMFFPSANSLQNSQCRIDAAGSSVSASGNTLTLNLAITFSSGFAGNRVFYVAARNGGTGNSDWQAVGSVTIP